MARLEVIIPLMVAIIGVMGTIIPIYISNSIFSDNRYPNIQIYSALFNMTDKELKRGIFEITNNGNTPATNLSITLDATPSNILTITNYLSTVEVKLGFNNTLFPPGETQQVQHTIKNNTVPKD